MTPEHGVVLPCPTLRCLGEIASCRGWLGGFGSHARSNAASVHGYRFAHTIINLTPATSVSVDDGESEVIARVRILHLQAPRHLTYNNDVVQWTANHMTLRNKPARSHMSFSGALRVAIRLALNNYRTHLVQCRTPYGGVCVLSRYSSA